MKDVETNPVERIVTCNNCLYSVTAGWSVYCTNMKRPLALSRKKMALINHNQPACKKYEKGEDSQAVGKGLMGDT